MKVVSWKIFVSVLKKFSSGISFKICINSLNSMLISNDLLMYICVSQQRCKKVILRKNSLQKDFDISLILPNLLVIA